MNDIDIEAFDLAIDATDAPRGDIFDDATFRRMLAVAARERRQLRAEAASDAARKSRARPWYDR